MKDSFEDFLIGEENCISVESERQSIVVSNQENNDFKRDESVIEILSRLSQIEKVQKRIEKSAENHHANAASRNDIEGLEEQNAELQLRINKLLLEVRELKSALENFLPHKRAFKVSLYFVLLFSSFIVVELLLGVEIINGFFASVGLFVSSGFLIMSYYLGVDWRKEVK